MGKTKQRKPTSSSKAVGPKQKRQMRAKLSVQSAVELPVNHRDRMADVSRVRLVLNRRIVKIAAVLQRFSDYTILLILRLLFPDYTIHVILQYSCSTNLRLYDYSDGPREKRILMLLDS